MAIRSPLPEPGRNWPTLAWLAGEMYESDRKSLLRSHKEGSPDSTDKEFIERVRKQLDKELEQLGALELKAQCGDEISAETIHKIPGFHTLIKSPAFVQYLNSYLYFGVRFAAGRLTNPCRNAGNHTQDQFNERPVGLPSPPMLEPADALKLAEKFLGIPVPKHADDTLDFFDNLDESPQEMAKFELWLRGLYFGEKEETDRFMRIAEDMHRWARDRQNFYVDLEASKGKAAQVERWQTGKWVEGQWQLTHPLAARCGVVDLYWMARILRAEVSARAAVRYRERSWLSYLPSLRPPVKQEADKNANEEVLFAKDDILRIEEVLRSVFDFACDLTQNAVEMAESCEGEKAVPDEYRKHEGGDSGKADPIVDWRAAFDRELIDVANQRKQRVYLDQHDMLKPSGLKAGEGRADRYWSERLRTGNSEQHLVGLALSGGGIRSATFSLGVLQGLKELDRLRHIDYLSTVSGGGYIGAWLLGNVRRTHYWLSRMTCWEESIGHLRRFSKYLAPQSGFLSADSWVIWGTWIRNAFLIQLTAVFWLAAAYVLVVAMKPVFEWAGSPNFLVVLALIFSVLALILIKNFKKTTTRPTQHRLAVLLVWVGSFLTAALLWRTATLWRDSTEPNHPLITQYSHILKGAIWIWPWQLTVPVFVLLFICLIALAFFSFWPKKRIWASIGTAMLTSIVAYLGLCGILYLFGIWASSREHYGWYAYVFGSALVLMAITLAMFIFIGLINGTSRDWKREWWTRYGAWLAIYGAGFMALGVAAVFSPVWLYKFFCLPWQSIKWGAVIGWLGSTIAGLMAGNSSKTKGKGQGVSKALEWVAAIGAVLFIAGAVIALSGLLHLVLVKVWLDAGNTWWLDFNSLLALKVVVPTGAILATLLLLLFCAAVFSRRFNINVFGMNQFYRNRLVRCYLGATRWRPGLRRPQGFTGFDEDDDIPLANLQFQSTVEGVYFRGPFPILNCALNLGGSSDLTVKTRQSASFSLTPLHAGSDRPKVGFAPVHNGNGFADCLTLGQAASISGAAASPNMGYNTTPLVAVLLTMFNVRLAWWFPNPGNKKWQDKSPKFSLFYLIWEFLGLADEKSNFVNVSDGGHFENLGIYELVRRRAKVIIACDAECDSDLAFGSLGNVIRICETDFGAKIDIDVTSIRKLAETDLSCAHCAVGKITYSNGSIGYLIYLKSSISGDEDVGVQQYHASHPDFPHQSTADQFFTEDQFESYRRLGHHIATVAFHGAEGEPNMVAVASKLYDLWAPAGFTSATFVNHTRVLDELWERLRTSGSLEGLLHELVADKPIAAHSARIDDHELSACLELLQLMENVFLDLRLDDFWQHPDNRGWAILFTTWAKSPKFRTAWNKSRRTFGIRFEYFCNQRLGLEKDHPVVRV